MFFEGEHITGSLDLILQSGDPIHSISISIKGKLTTGPNIHDAQVFLDKMTLLWNRSMGNPRLPSCSSESPPKFTSKLLGDYYWPFSIHLPREVTLWSAEGLGEQNFRLPETFMERLTRASVHYEMTVLITRGILRSDSRIETKIAYFPCTRPSPPSRLQQIAYQQGSRLPGPESDPDGWFTHDLTVRGTLRGRAILANCQFSLARPLCYTRGGVIPLKITLETPDTGALTALAAPGAIRVVLKRTMHFPLASATSSDASGITLQTQTTEIAEAVWWPRNRGRGTEGIIEEEDEEVNLSHRCCLDGEIAIPREAKPNSSMAHFSIDYSVVFEPFAATGFYPAHDEPMVEEPIEVATLFPHGPRPRSCAPAGTRTIKKERKPSMIFLEPPSRIFV
jgi:hypothetical protein